MKAAAVLIISGACPACQGVGRDTTFAPPRLCLCCHGLGITYKTVEANPMPPVATPAKPNREVDVLARVIQLAAVLGHHDTLAA